MSQDVHIFTDANFSKDVLGSNIPVLVDFWAEWCGPCRMMIPILSELAPLYKGRVTIGKMNVDENQGTPAQFGVMNIPTMIVFKGGAEVERIVGAMSKNDLGRKIDRILSGS